MIIKPYISLEFDFLAWGRRCNAFKTAVSLLNTDVLDSTAIRTRLNKYGLNESLTRKKTLLSKEGMEARSQQHLLNIRLLVCKYITGEEMKTQIRHASIIPHTAKFGLRLDTADHTMQLFAHLLRRQEVLYGPYNTDSIMPCLKAHTHIVIHCVSNRIWRLD